MQPVDFLEYIETFVHHQELYSACAASLFLRRRRGRHRGTRGKGRKLAMYN